MSNVFSSICRGASFRTAFANLGSLACCLSYCAPAVLALSATIPDAMISTLTTSLMLDSPVIITEPQDFSRFFFTVTEKLPQKDEALREILSPIVVKLKSLLTNLPKTVIFAAHTLIPLIYNYFLNKLGSIQCQYSLVVQFHGQLTSGTQSKILQELRLPISR